MMTVEEFQSFKEKIDAIKEELDAIVVDGKELPAEKVERLLHIKAKIRRIINTL